MAQSLGLSAYMAFARRKHGVPDTFATPRPDGELVWGHATTPDHANALIQLADRLAQQRPGLHLLITTNGFRFEPSSVKPNIILSATPAETVTNAEAFLAHWRPDVCLWTGGAFIPVLLICADRAEVPLFLIDANEAALNSSNRRWLPDLSRAILKRFSFVLARSGNAAQALLKLGMDPDDISVTGPFLEGATPLPSNETEREELSKLLAGRPVWLAARIQLEELETVLRAHRGASRLAHRLLLIVVPDQETLEPAFLKSIKEDGWRVACWAEGHLPDETSQVILADSPADLGLWYRLAPVAFMGSSLVSGQSGRDPNEPAAHGSAILYGPNVGRYLSAYSRFAAAGAARIVRDSATLTTALQQLTAPDQSAAMAHAAWDVATQGAAVTDKIMDLVQDTLDVMEAH